MSTINDDGAQCVVYGTKVKKPVFVLAVILYIRIFFFILCFVTIS